MGSVVVFRRGVSLLSVFLCACAASPAPNVPPSPPVGVESRWQVLQRDGQPLGRRQQWHYQQQQFIVIISSSNSASSTSRS